MTILFLFRSIASFSQTAVNPGVGSVEGVVFGEDNKPLSGASVYGLPEQDMRKEIWGTSDKVGKFTLQNVPAGNVYVHAFKESEGYPNNFYAFYKVTAHSSVKLEIKPGEATDVTIQLGPKAAYLKVDATNEKGKRVAVGGYQLDRDDVPGPYITSVPTDPRLVGVGFINGVMLVPPVPFRLTVRSDGYEPWHYGGAKWQTKHGLIALKSGRTLVLHVRLKHSR